MQEVNGRKHWFGDHPTPRMNRKSKYEKWVTNFAAAIPGLKSAGVEVINCTPVTALKCFHQMSLKDAF
jgi:hypothetical protein